MEASRPGTCYRAAGFQCVGRTAAWAERDQPCPEDIRSCVVWLARVVDFRPSKRRPLPGNEVPWRACAKIKKDCAIQPINRASLTGRAVNTEHGVRAQCFRKRTASIVM